MEERLTIVRDRRALLRNGLGVAAALALPSGVSANGRVGARITGQGATAMPATVPAAPMTSSRVVRPELLRRALGALDQHGASLLHRDRIAIADFAAPSRQPRFHFIDLAAGTSESLLVAHGRGSDPSHTGWLSRFSNDDGSFASCEGAFLAGDYYVGKHGQSQRLHGLDATNSNALARAIVVHSAWYSNPDMISSHGMLGRSEGCFAVGERDLARAFAMLGQGRMIYAAKV
jgi:hypothetical protein